HEVTLPGIALIGNKKDLIPIVFYEYPPTESGMPRRSRRVPWLQMRGDWLSAAGFEIRAPVKVRVMRGCLVVTVAEED
ncbi:SymE family type I addiction module toxin, partial [Endothiovibrio diazotrophicus]